MSIVGGTVSEIGGGKFSNGAWGSLFQYMFNDLITDIAFNRDGTHNDPVVEENIARFAKEFRAGLVKGLQDVSTMSSFAALASASTGQEYAAGLFFVTGYISDYSLLYMGELPPQTMFNNLYLDATMYQLTNRYPLSGGLMNIGTKTLVNQ